MDLSTKYLGLDLKHPIVASAGPISKTLEGIKSLEDAGAAAVVMFSLFEEQLLYENEAYDYFATGGLGLNAESMSYFPAIDKYEVGPSQYLTLISRAKEATDIPIIASLNGATSMGWTGYAKDMEDAGADAIELNIYFFPASLTATGRMVEQHYVDIVEAVRKVVTIPVAVKMSPYFSAPADMGDRLVAAGANGLVLFNRFYQPDFDLNKLEVVPSLQLSQQTEMRLPLLWISILHGRLPASLAGTTGVHQGTDVAKYLLAGADVAMTTSSLLENGVEHLGVLLNGLETWMARNSFESVSQMKGAMSQMRVPNPSSFERANYLKILQSYKPATAGK